MSLFGNFMRRVFGDLFGRIDDLGLQAPPAPAVCPISWQPSVTAPVFYGTHDYAPPPLGVSLRRSPLLRWPPGTFRVFYPSLDGSPPDAAMLEPCGHYPLIVFLHGHCSADDPYNYTKWYEIPADLARSGYVVVVPHLHATGTGTYPSTENHRDIPLILSIMRWMRTDWPFARVLMPEPATGIMGHSFGAVLAARIALEQQRLAAQQLPAIRISAFASLSGVWDQWPDMQWPIFDLTIPQLFLFGSNDTDADVRNAGIWNRIHTPKHRAVFDRGEHWDYLPPGRSSCGNNRGPCNLVGVVSRDMVSAFFGKYLPPERWAALGGVIPDNLIATLEMPDSFERSFYAGGHLTGFPALDNAAMGAGCSFALAWQTANGAGDETHP
jgi:hypothetical protein